MNLQNIYLKLKSRYPNLDESDIRRMAWVERDRKIYESLLSKSSSQSNSSAGKVKTIFELPNFLSIKLSKMDFNFQVDLDKIDDKWYFKALLGGDILIDIIFIKKENDLYNVYLFDADDYDDFPFELIASSDSLLGDYNIINDEFISISVGLKKDINYCLNYNSDDFFDVVGISASNNQFYPYQLGDSDGVISNSFYSDLTDVKFDVEFFVNKWILSVNDLEIAELISLDPIGTYTNYLDFDGEFTLTSGSCFI